jgi:type VI secretion system protein VasG
MMTSNLGSAITEEMCAQEEQPEIEEILEGIRAELNRHFKPALLARMTVIPYRPISEAVMKRITGLKLRKVALRLKQNHNMNLAVDASVIKSISDRCRLVEAGARNIDHILNSELLPQIAESILGYLLEGELPQNLTVSVEDGAFQLAFN